MQKAVWKDLHAQDLMRAMQGLCSHERSALCDFLHGLAAIEERALHLQLGFPNMFELCRIEFGLSEGCIYRRLQVARKIRHYPELFIALQQSQLNLTLASMLCPYLGKHAWSELLQRVQGKTKRAAQKALLDLEKGPEQAAAKSRIQYLGRETYCYKLKVPAEMHHQFERSKELLSHQIPDGDLNQILATLLRTYLNKHDPQFKKAVPAELWQEYSSPSRYIPRGLKTLLLEKAGHQCQYQSPDGRRCSQKRYLDIDHIQPLAAGGQTSLNNLQVLCHAHNLLKSDQFSPLTNHNHLKSLNADGEPLLQRKLSFSQKFKKIAQNE